MLPLLVWALGWFATGHASALSAKGEKAPDFKVKTLDGKHLTLKSLISPGKNQKKVVVLAFWATWCPPCCKEAPHLNAIHKKYSGKSVAVIGIAIDQEGAKPVREAVKKMGLKYTIGLDPDGARAADKYGVDYIPSLFVVDSHGIIRYTRQGYQANLEHDLGAVIDSLLKRK